MSAPHREFLNRPRLCIKLLADSDEPEKMMDSWLESFARANFLRSGDTAHDLKTPLNVAVLNLELLRMRVRKVLGHDDEKLNDYAQAIDSELRRMARIFDTFFILSTPPKNEGDPVDVDLCSLCSTAAAEAGWEIAVGGSGVLRGHESRLRQTFKLFFEGTARVLQSEARKATVAIDGNFAVSATGTPEAADFEPSKLFKFYYTDPLGNPDLSLASARLIAETYGGDLSASEESGKVTIRLTFPLR